MSSYNSIEEFALDLQQQIIAEANIKDLEKFHEQVFIDFMLDELYEASEIENGIRCQHKSIGMKVDGYNFNEELMSLDLITANYDDDPVPPISYISKSEIDIAFKRALTFYDKSCNESKFLNRLEDSAEIIDLTRIINKSAKEIRKVRIILLTNSLIRKFDIKPFIHDNIEVTYQIWDIQRLFRFRTSGIKNEPIQVNFEEILGKPLECVTQKDTSGLYDTYLSIIPGSLLAGLYEKWGTRLLERNVRAYLQAQNKKGVNYGMKETLKNEKHLFLAYNNGITVTAQSVIVKESQKSINLSTATDFQIVNGGQTTASLWHINYRDKYPLDGVQVQMKLTVINDSNKIDEITPKISKYSNSQNKVNTADFSANDPFHVILEQISRATWAPDPLGGNKQTKWFYERARGSFYETRNREKKDSEKKIWDIIHLRNQKFDKTYLAKVEKTWMLQPFEVSLGAQKNFSRFSLYLKEQNIVTADELYFKRLIGKIIIWKAAEIIISKQNIPGYRANIVAYTLSYLVYLTGNKIDLDKIWINQEAGIGLAECIHIVAHFVREHITNTNQNVTEYCKKESCWQKLIETKIDLPQSLNSELIDISYTPYNNGTIPGSKDDANIEWVSSISADIWKKVSRWGSLTKSLEGWENSMCFNIGRSLSNNKKPSSKLAKQGKLIYEKALQRGFSNT